MDGNIYLVFVPFQFEEAAREVADEITKPRPAGEETVQDIQIILHSSANCANLRSLKVFILFSI